MAAFLLPIVLCGILLTATSSYAQTSAKVELIPYHAFLSLSPRQKEKYLEELRKIMAEFSTAPSGVRQFIVDSDPSDQSKLYVDNPLWWIKGPSTQALIQHSEKAYAQSEPCSTLERGRRSLMCIEGTAMGTQCICEETPSSFHAWEGEKPQSQSQLFEYCAMTGRHSLIYFGGKQVCVTTESLNGYRGNLAEGLGQSFNLAISDAERSKALGSSRNRVLKADQVHAYAITTPKTQDYFSTTANAEVKTTLHGNGSEAAVWESSHAAFEASQAASLAEQAAKAKDPEAKKDILARAEEERASAERFASHAVESQKEHSEELQAEMRTADTKGEVVRLAGVVGSAIADRARALYNMFAAEDQVERGAAALEGDKSKEGQKLRGDFAMTDKEFESYSDMVKKETARLSQASQKMVSESNLKESNQLRINDATRALEVAATADKVDLQTVDFRDQQLQKTVETVGREEGVKISPAALGTDEETRECLESGNVDCKTKYGKDQEGFRQKRIEFLSTRVDEHNCIFGGNASRMSAEAETRSGKKKMGCLPVKEVTLETTHAGQEKMKLTCPINNKFKKPVMCNPLLFGALKDSEGKLHGACVEWTGVVTADCAYVYRRKPKKSVLNGMEYVPAQDILTDPKFKLERQWEAIAKTLNLRCNSNQFRAIHCQECDTLADRLGGLKAKVTQGTCNWPSDVRSIREGIKQGSEAREASQ